jgi:hypothetical protein
LSDLDVEKLNDLRDNTENFIQKLNLSAYKEYLELTKNE